MKIRIIHVLLLCALLLTGCAPKESFSPSSSPSPSDDNNLETEPRTIGEVPSIGILRYRIYDCAIF